MTKKHFPHSLMCDDFVRGARPIGERTGKTTKRVYHEFEKRFRGIPYVQEGSVICLSLSLYEAARFARAVERASFSGKETAWIEMHLAVRKAAALIEQLIERDMSLENPTPDELACYAEVMDSAVAATSKMIELLRPSVSDSGRADEAQATV